MKKFLLFIPLLTLLNTHVTSAQNPNESIPRITSTGERPVRLHELSVRIDIVGGIAVTVYDMSFYNPNHRQLEGELTFPLSEREIVTGYALEVNGAMREGVVVDKDKGRQVFEEIVNRQVDPGLLEKATGNSYKTRIYPVPTRGYKRVRITTEQHLRRDGDGCLYVLPMTSPEPVEKFSLTARVIRGEARPRVLGSPLSNFRFSEVRDVYEATYTKRNQKLTRPLIFTVPGEREHAFTEKHDGQQWFYVSIPVTQPVIVDAGDESPRGTVAVWWDISLSGLKRDIEKELALLDAYLATMKGCRVEVVTFSEVFAHDRQIFTEGSRALEYIRGLRYDGATDLSCLADGNKSGADRILLFSDGKSSLRQDVSGCRPDAPLYAVVSGADNDYTALNVISNGQVINLATTGIDEAVRRLESRSMQIIDIKVVSGTLSDIYPRPGAYINGDIAVTGRLQSASALVEISWGIGSRVVETRRVAIGTGCNESGAADNSSGQRPGSDLSRYGVERSGLLARLWAGEKISELALDPARNREQIVELAVRYGVVTDYTSLIVLEDLGDYIMYDITPPAELQTEEYFRALNSKKAGEEEESLRKENDRKTLIEKDYAAYYKPVIEWWQTRYEPFDPVKAAREREKVEKEARQRRYAFSGSTSVVSDDLMIVTSDIDQLELQEVVVAPIQFKEEEVLADEIAFLRVERVDEAAVSALSGRVAGVRVENDLSGTAVHLRGRGQTAARSTINMAPWKSDAPYMEQLDSIPTRDLYDEYFRMREEYSASPSFYADVADELFRRGERLLARRVLSNLIEISGENVELVKTYGQKLIEYGYYKEAVPVFEYGVTLRTDQPQSYRDLALAHELAGNYPEALSSFMEVVTRRWTRFDNIKPIVFAEMNSLVDRHRKSLDLSGVDERLLFSMPVNTRVAISWDTDNCDIDLHVTEPSGENCYYGRPLTKHGGWMSADFTAGFGPEAYMIKEKNPGVFSVTVNYFGSHSQSQLMPVTVYADVFTDYGTPRQQRRRITLRLAETKDKYTVGEITVE